jgi:hypothetical protein
MMKRNFIAIALLLLCAVLALPALSVADDARRDGNWWRVQGESVRADYMGGFYDGMNLGYYFSYSSIVKNNKADPCRRKVAESFHEHLSKFKNVKSLQVVDGLNSFYGDFRNRSILVTDAVWLVVNSIVGTPKKELDKMIEDARRDAQ